MPAIHAQSLTKIYQSEKSSLTVLRDVNLSIPSGQTCALVGPSGSGKTTLLGLLAGLDYPDSGTVSLLGVNVEQNNERELRKLRRESIGFVFQSFHLLPSLTALENVAIPLQLQRAPSAFEQAQQWLEKVGLAARGSHYIWELSGGERQRVALARAFISKPALLFADEPTGNLDRKNAEEVWNLLLDLNTRSQTTLLLATHNQELAKKCDRCLRVQDAQVLEENMQ